MDGWVSAAAFLIILAIAVFGLVAQKPIIRMVAHLTTTREGLEKLRRAVSEACADYDVGTQDLDQAEEDIEDLARHAIGRCLAEMNPKRAITVTRDWPTARCIITGDIAVIAVDIGFLVMGPHARIEPLTVRVKREHVVTLDNRRPIKTALAEIYEPPPKQIATAAKPAAKPRPKPVPR
jgi:hypothetical protein